MKTTFAFRNIFWLLASSALLFVFLVNGIVLLIPNSGVLVRVLAAALVVFLLFFTGVGLRRLRITWVKTQNQAARDNVALVCAKRLGTNMLAIGLTLFVAATIISVAGVFLTYTKPPLPALLIMSFFIIVGGAGFVLAILGAFLRKGLIR
jgi:hypothetical protein